MNLILSLIFLKNWCYIWAFWPQIPVVWHQAHPIWLMQSPRHPNSYVLQGHFILEVIRFLLHNVVFSEVMRSAQEKITSWLRAELLLRASQSWAAAKMLSFFQPITERNYVRLGDAISKTIWSEEFQNYFLVPVRIQFGRDLENPWWIPKWITTYIHPI